MLLRVYLSGENENQKEKPLQAYVWKPAELEQSLSWDHPVIDP